MAGDPIAVRPSSPADLATIVRFNLELALETEGLVLDRDVLQRGVAATLAAPGLLRYWIATADDRPVGQAAVSLEWSDWRNGWIWWLQSVYVDEAIRGQGVLRTLLEAIRSAAHSDGNVIGLRLYVEDRNTRAQTAYTRLGFKPGGYAVLEDIWDSSITTAHPRG